MCSSLFSKLLSRMHIFAKHILRSILGKGDQRARRQLCQRLGMQLPGQNLPQQQEQGRGNLLAARNSACCPLLLWSSHSLLTQLQVQAWTVFIPILVSYKQSTSSIFRITGLTECCLSAKESGRAKQLRKHKITASTDFKRTKSLFSYNTEHQVGSC